MPSASRAHFAVGWFMNRRAVSSRKLNCLTPTESTSSTPAPVPTGISVSLPSWRLSSIGDPRVDVRVGDVGQQVEQNDQDGGNRQDAHQEGVVERLQCLEKQLAHPGPAENRLGDHRAREEQGQLNPDVGHNREQRVSQRMLEYYDTLAEPFGPGGP